MIYRPTTCGMGRLPLGLFRGKVQQRKGSAMPHGHCAELIRNDSKMIFLYEANILVLESLVCVVCSIYAAAYSLLSVMES